MIASLPWLPPESSFYGRRTTLSIVFVWNLWCKSDFWVGSHSIRHRICRRLEEGSHWSFCLCDLCSSKISIRYASIISLIIVSIDANQFIYFFIKVAQFLSLFFLAIKSYPNNQYLEILHSHEENDCCCNLLNSHSYQHRRNREIGLVWSGWNHQNCPDFGFHSLL
jgi:hypothetical protein